MDIEQDQLPALADEYPLAPSQIEEYRAKGHILLREVCNREEVSRYRRFIRDAAMRNSSESRPMDDRDTYGRAFLQVTNLWERDDAVRRFVLAKRFAGIAARLTGSPAMRLYHDQALFKEPSGGRTPWHQDQHYWPMDTDSSITMWMAMVQCTPEMGTMRFASGTHQTGYLGELSISEESDQRFSQLVSERGIDICGPYHLDPGDATFHAGWTLHAAGENKTQSMREAMTVIYFPDGTRVIEPDHPDRLRDMQVWFPGLKPGDFAASTLNPIVWP